MAAAASTPFEVVIIGGGLAGLSAAIEASASPNVHVTIVEKEARCGGNSAKATSGINGVGTQTQAKAEVVDTIPEFDADTHESGHGLCDPALVAMLTANSKAAVEFLEGHGECA